MAAINRLVQRFNGALQAAETNTDIIKAEFCDMIAYSVQYIAISSVSTPQALLSGKIL